MLQLSQENCYKGDFSVAAQVYEYCEVYKMIVCRVSDMVYFKQEDEYEQEIGFYTASLALIAQNLMNDVTSEAVRKSAAAKLATWPAPTSIDQCDDFIDNMKLSHGEADKCAEEAFRNLKDKPEIRAKIASSAEDGQIVIDFIKNHLSSEDKMSVLLIWMHRCVFELTC